ncbi:MAG: class I mannose-6-phosphate isomerase [Opitutaceae bacterium]|nr:class I mannose-6-phosphate isomerase [Opitutaceae bacterium]
MSHRGKLILLPPNRVWRTYPGGRTLDALAGAAAPADSHLAEDWIASTTRAANRGREHIPEGVSQVRLGHDPAPHDFAALLASDAEYFLGAAHAARYGAQPQLLVKFLDSGTRLHFQVHPTREFAQRVLGAPSGKTEAYHVLATRDPANAFIYVGFQRPPTPAQLRDYIVTQNIAAIEACFDPIPVQPGDTFIIPGGTPHALGAGLFLVEIQEPSDLVVRFEFERAGYVLPEAARFMGRDVDFALTVFNLTPLTASDLATRVRCTPRRVRALGPSSHQDELIGPNQTDCFRVLRSTLAAPITKQESAPVIGIVTAGTLTVEAGGEVHPFRTSDKFFLPAGLGPARFTPGPAGCTLLECLPPAP